MLGRHQVVVAVGNVALLGRVHPRVGPIAVEVGASGKNLEWQKNL